MIIKKKLRDITKKEYEKWREKECKTNKILCGNCPFNIVHCDTIRPWYNNKEILSDKFLNQEIDIEVPDILDETEKKYLSAVIRPFKKRVDYIMKSSNSCCDKEYIFIRLDDDFLSLPYFTAGTMYQGMELERAYTLEELGL